MWSLVLAFCTGQFHVRLAANLFLDTVQNECNMYSWDEGGSTVCA